MLFKDRVNQDHWVATRIDGIKMCDTVPTTNSFAVKVLPIS